MNLQGKTVLVRERFADPLRLFRCLGGFGCDPDKMGRAVFGTWLSDGSSDRIDRGDVLRLATREEIANAQAYANRPPAERMLAQMKEHHESAMRAWKSVENKKRATVREWKDVALKFRQEHARLAFILQQPADPADVNVPDCETNLQRYCRQWGGQWDKANKER